MAIVTLYIWEPIDTAPKDKTIIFGKVGSESVWIGYADSDRGDATHWCYFPDPPKEVEDNGKR